MQLFERYYYCCTKYQETTQGSRDPSSSKVSISLRLNHPSKLSIYAGWVLLHRWHILQASWEVPRPPSKLKFTGMLANRWPTSKVFIAWTSWMRVDSVSCNNVLKLAEESSLKWESQSPTLWGCFQGGCCPTSWCRSSACQYFIEVSSRLVLTRHVWSELYKLIWVEVPAALSGDDFSSWQRGCPCQMLLREHWSGGMQITNLWIGVCLMRKPCQLVLTSWPLKMIHLNEWVHSLGLRVGLHIGAWPIADTSHMPNTDQAKGRRMMFHLAEMVLEEYWRTVVGKMHKPRVGACSFFPPVRSSCWQ